MRAPRRTPWHLAGASALLFSTAALLGRARPAQATLRLVSLEDIDPGAVCTDGSPAGYYWEASSTPEGAALWVVYLQGGGWCYSEETCKSRCGGGSTSPLCSSKAWNKAYTREGCKLPAPCSEGGIFTPSHSPALQGANKVFIRYCTSDAHLGDAAAFGFQFRGTRVVRAVLSDLVARRRLGEANPHHGKKDVLIFAGGSAGARGAMAHLDYVESMLGPMNSGRSLEIVGFLDSPFWVDLEPLRTGIDSIMDQTRGFFSYANATHLGAGCVNRYKGAEGWKCLFAEYRMPFVGTKYLMVASLYDKFQLDYDLGHLPAGAVETRYAEKFANRTEKLVQKLADSTHSVFSWACYSHMQSITANFGKATCGGTTMQSALEQFIGVAPRNGSTLRWVDSCKGFSCGNGCASHPSLGSEHTAAKPAPAVVQIGAAFQPGARPAPSPEESSESKHPAEVLSFRNAEAKASSSSQSTLSTSLAPEAMFLKMQAEKLHSMLKIRHSTTAPSLEQSTPKPSTSTSRASTTTTTTLAPRRGAKVDCSDLQGHEATAVITMADFKRRMLSSYTSVKDAFVALHLDPVDLWSPQPHKSDLDHKSLDMGKFIVGTESFEPPLTKDEALDAFTTMDVDRDYKVEFQEFRDSMACVQEVTASQAPKPITSTSTSTIIAATAAALEAPVTARATTTSPNRLPTALHATPQRRPPAETEGGAIRDARGAPITMEEFKRCMLEAYNSPEDAFAALDASPSHLEEFIRLTKTFKPPLTVQQAEYSFRALDADHDNALASFEFLGSLAFQHFFPDGKEGSIPIPGATSPGRRRERGVLAVIVFSTFSLLMLLCTLFVTRPLCHQGRRAPWSWFSWTGSKSTCRVPEVPPRDRAKYGLLCSNAEEPMTPSQVLSGWSRIKRAKVQL